MVAPLSCLEVPIADAFTVCCHMKLSTGNENAFKLQVNSFANNVYLVLPPIKYLSYFRAVV